MAQHAWAMDPIKRSTRTDRTIERTEIPAGDETEAFVQLSGQTTWIRATKSQAEQAAMLGLPVRVDRIVLKLVP